jgi:hypothetical protein
VSESESDKNLTGFLTGGAKLGAQWAQRSNILHNIVYKFVSGFEL